MKKKLTMRKFYAAKMEKTCSLTKLCFNNWKKPSSVVAYEFLNQATQEQKTFKLYSKSNYFTFIAEHIFFLKEKTV